MKRNIQKFKSFQEGAVRPAVRKNNVDINIDKKYLIENLKITYNDYNNKTILTNDKDEVNDDIFYNVSVVPIPCNE